MGRSVAARGRRCQRPRRALGSAAQAAAQATRPSVAAYAERAAALRWDEAATGRSSRRWTRAGTNRSPPLYGRLPVGRLDARRANAERWLQAHPASPALLLTLARLARAQDQWPQAEDYLHRALAQGAGADAWEELGHGFAAIGDETRARLSYANALRAGARRSGGRTARARPAPADPRPGRDRGTRRARRAASARIAAQRWEAGQEHPFPIRPLLRRGRRGLALEDRDHAHAAGGADRHQAAAAAALLQFLGRGGDDARAGRGERMAGRQRGAVGVDLAPDRCGPAARPGPGACGSIPRFPTRAACTAPARRRLRGFRRSRNPAGSGRCA